MPAGRKRKAVDAPGTPDVSGSRRRSTRIGSSGKKSRYFEQDSEDSEPEQDKPVSKRASATKGRRKSGGEKKAKVEAEEEEDDGDAYQEPDSEEDADKGEEEQEDSEDEFDEDAPPKVTFIPLPKMRDTGGVAYKDDRLHKNTLLFLKDLKANNKRPWLKSHDDEYRRSLKDWESYVETLTSKIAQVDETIPELPVRDVIFRIYRDIRFSLDPTPYKAHYSAAWSRTGRKGPYACYYVHAEPGKCYVGGGLWHPPADALARLRASIDARPARWRRVLCAPAFRRLFLPAVAGPKNDDKAVFRAFADANKEGALKTKPKNYAADHPSIELIKLRNFVIGTKVDDEALTSPTGQAQIAEIFGTMAEFVTHINNIVMPDPGADDGDDDDDGDDE